MSLMGAAAAVAARGEGAEALAVKGALLPVRTVLPPLAARVVGEAGGVAEAAAVVVGAAAAGARRVAMELERLPQRLQRQPECNTPTRHGHDDSTR